MNLNDLMEDLYSDSGITKTASVNNNQASQELAGILEKKAEADLTNQAFAQGEELAKKLLEKMASTMEAPASTTTKGNNEMNDNSSLANYILEKVAQEFDPTVTTPAAQENFAPGAVPNQIQVGQAQMTAFDDQKAQGIVPGGDGTVNALFDTIVAKAVANGAGSYENTPNIDKAIPGVTDAVSQGDEVEKAAAVSALCEAGMNFDYAVDLVKQAEQEIAVEAWDHEKTAAFNALIDAGVDFDSAAIMVKEAEEELFEKEAAGKYDPSYAARLVGEAKQLYHGGRSMFSKSYANAVQKGNLQTLGKQIEYAAKNPKNKEIADYTAKQKLNNLAFAASKDRWAGMSAWEKAKEFGGAAANTHVGRIGAGVAGAGAVGAGVAAYNHHQKKAAFDQLIAEGVDFDTAADLVKEAAGPKNIVGGVRRVLAESMVMGKRRGNPLSMKREKAWELAKIQAKKDWGTFKRKTGKFVSENKVPLAAAGGAGAAAGGYAAYRAHEKKSAFDQLVAEGFDFDTAADLVKQAEYEVYGE